VLRRVATALVALAALGLAPAGAAAFGPTPQVRALLTGPPLQMSISFADKRHTDPAKPLAGKVVGIDPGHNGGNFSDPGTINAPVWNGREEEACDTTGTETDGGYTEARFNFNVASYLRADLLAAGARVVMTRRSNSGVGPCIDRRAQILNKAGADVAIDIHADGGPAGGRGFAILLPVADGPNDHVIAASRRFGRILANSYERGTGIPRSNYDGTDGFAPRDDLAGLNLATEPKVLIETGNMRNATDAARLVKPAFQKAAAKSFAAAIVAYLGRR
jgi:N-acetylmuramoyl-L-alanine amidase